MGGRLIKTDIDIAMEQTRNETEDRVRVMSIQSLMETRGFTLKEAMESLQIPQEKRGTYAKLLEQSDVEYDAQK